MNIRWPGTYVHNIWIDNSDRGNIIGRVAYERVLRPSSREEDMYTPCSYDASWDPLPRLVVCDRNDYSISFYVGELFHRLLKNLVTGMVDYTSGVSPAMRIGRVMCSASRTTITEPPMCAMHAGKNGLEELLGSVERGLYTLQGRRRVNTISFSVISRLITEAYNYRRACGGGLWFSYDAFKMGKTRPTVTVVLCTWSWRRWNVVLVRGFLLYPLYSLLEHIVGLLERLPRSQPVVLDESQKKVRRYVYIQLPRFIAAALVWRLDFFERSSHSIFGRFGSSQAATKNQQSTSLLSTPVRAWEKRRLCYIKDYGFTLLFRPYDGDFRITHPLSKRSVLLTATKIESWPLAFGLYASDHLQSILRDLGLTEEDLKQFQWWCDNYPDRVDAMLALRDL